MDKIKKQKQNLYPRHKYSTNYMYKHTVIKNKKYNSISFFEKKKIYFINLPFICIIQNMKEIALFNSVVTSISF